jgi:biphenyl 2,3-dioxygenase ferredoxin reductase subunit
MTKSITIVGGGLAAVRSAEALRAEGFSGAISMINGEGVLPYDRPSLSKSVLLEPGSGPPPLIEAGWFTEAGVDLLDGEVAIAIDPANGGVELQSGRILRADRILLATGAQARWPAAFPRIEGVFSLRSHVDGRDLADALRTGVEVVIIGGGLIGCEVATAARKQGCNVTIIEALDELVVRALGHQVGSMCRAWLNEAGITTLTDVAMSHIVGGRRVEAVALADGRLISADVVLISIGVEPMMHLAHDAQLPCGRDGVIVDASGETAAERVFAAGDVASWPVRGGIRRCLETYLNSQEQAGVAARAMLGIKRPSIQLPQAWTEIAGRYIQTIGTLAGEGRVIVREEPSGTMFFRHAGGRLEACVAIDAMRNFGIARRLVDGRAVVDDASLADGQISLRDIAAKAKEAQHAAS